MHELSPTSTGIVNANCKFNLPKLLKIAPFPKPNLNGSWLHTGFGAVGRVLRQREYEMFNRQSMLKLSGLATAAVLLTACGGSSYDKEELARMAAKYNMSLTEKLAFKACFENTKRATPVLTYNEQLKMMSEVPLEVCGCQAKTIALTLKENKLDNYAAFVTWVSKPVRKGTVTLSADDLLPKVTRKMATETLAKTFDSCATASLNDTPGLPEKILSAVDTGEERRKEREQKAKEKAAQAEIDRKNAIDF
jgi:hypothetical protein